ncbi:MAG: universal stress protein [Oxalobacter sp.]|jgi:CPA2 family monovalent cation:H+ antiporter-2|nr:universal stress protein [Oxalobacter sp.]
MPEKSYILTATDMSDWAKHAETKGAALAKSLGNTDMLLVTVQEQMGGIFSMGSAEEILSQELYQREAKRMLAEKAEQLSKEYGITVTPITRVGNVTDEIKALIKEEKPSLLVIGAHGQGYHFMPIIGNIPVKLIQGNDCPTLIIRQEEMRPYKKVLIPVDFSEVSVNQIKQAMEFVPEDAEITLMGICESPSSDLKFYSSVEPAVLEAYRNTIKEKGQVKMDQLIEKVGSSRQFKTYLEIGVPYRVMLNYVKTNGMDLLVLGKHRRLRLEDYLIGSTIHYAINEAECDVLVTPSMWS